MILVTGGTGFIGQALIRQLVEDGHRVRALVRPSKATPRLPKGVAVEASISSITDERGLRAAMVGVDSIYHLVGVEWRGAREAHQIEIDGIHNLLDGAKDAGVKRIYYLSHLGANRASAYPVLKTKGEVEEAIVRSGIEHTILRAGLIFGPGDHFTTALAKLLYAFPGFFPIPGDGSALIQPLWVEDLVAILAWMLESEVHRNQVYEVGGPEQLTIRQAIEEVMAAMGVRRYLVGLRPSTLRILGVIAEYFLPRLPLSVDWLDYLADSRVCDLDSVSRRFELLPARFSKHLGYLENRHWGRELLGDLFRR